MDSITSFLFGGLATALLFPFSSYLLIRMLNAARTKIVIEPAMENTVGKYTTIGLRIENKSWATLKNLTAFISIKYTAEDIQPDPNIQAYSVTTSDRPLMLSWAKVVDGNNIPHIDLNQAEPADLNLIRSYSSFNLPILQVASEQGFGGAGTGKKGRLILRSDKNYCFQILLTADNMLPIKNQYEYDSESNTVINR